MLAAPEDMDGDALRGALARGWGLGVASMEYRAVGWGSHHWEVLDERGERWFVTVDELENKRVSDAESAGDGFTRLRAALRSAVALREAGCAFVVAPVPGDGGEPAVAFGGRFAVAVYPFVDGERSGWGEWTPEARAGTHRMIAAVHMAPAWVRRYAFADDFRLPFRELTEAACDGWRPPETGPYTSAVARLLREHAVPVRRWLDRYDGLVAVARERPGRDVLTHGEPHPGNVMRTGDSWRLIDWDTAAIAPPERDLWSLDPGDGSLLGRYAADTGVTPLPELIELYRLGWDIKDIAYDAAHFFRPHADGANETKSWELLGMLVRRAGHLVQGLAP
jgi:aminoglycoside phosphotransferase (APT) family kinase protein